MDEVDPHSGARRRSSPHTARASLSARVTPIAGRADVRAALGALPDGPTPLDHVLTSRRDGNPRAP